MFAGSVTFTLSITGLTADNFDTITDVAFGLGPDGANSPDEDDVGAGLPTQTTPEPGTFILTMLGAGLLGVVQRRRQFKLRRLL